MTFVATVRLVTKQSTNVTYRVDDGTGTIEVKQWIDAEQGATIAETAYLPSFVSSTLVDTTSALILRILMFASLANSSLSTTSVTSELTPFGQ